MPPASISGQAELQIRASRIGSAEIDARPSRHCPCSSSRRLAADKPGLADRDVELVLADHAAQAQSPRRHRRREDQTTIGNLRPPSVLRRLLSSAGVAAAIVPSADIHSGQVGSQPGALLRTTTKPSANCRSRRHGYLRHRPQRRRSRRTRKDTRQIRPRPAASAMSDHANGAFDQSEPSPLDAADISRG